MRYKHCISLKTRTLRFKFRMAIKKSLGKSNKCFKTIMFLYMHGGYNWCASLRQKVYIRRRLYLQLFVSHLIKNENKSQLNTHTTSMSLISHKGIRIGTLQQKCSELCTNCLLILCI